MIEAVIFDLFGTVVKIQNRQNPYRRLLQKGAQQGRAASLGNMRSIMTFNGGVHEAADAFGIKLSANEIAVIQDQLELELTSIRPFQDALPAMEQLRSHGIKLGVCSNLAAPYCTAVRRLLPGLDAYALSAELGLMKPDPAMYRITCAKLGVLPERVVGSKAAQVLMIGDSRRCDRDGPRTIGILGYHLDRNRAGRFGDLLEFSQAITSSCD